jgi:hypothetical protein
MSQNDELLVKVGQIVIELDKRVEKQAPGLLLGASGFEGQYYGETGHLI